MTQTRGGDDLANGESTRMPNNDIHPNSQPDADIAEAQERKMYVVCVDHLERALEEYVDEYLRAPDVYLTSDEAAAAAAGGRPVPPTCQFCGERAKYLVI